MNAPLDRVYEVRDSMYAWLTDNEGNLTLGEYAYAHAMLEGVVSALEDAL